MTQRKKKVDLPKWPHESAGHRMTAQVPTAQSTDTIGDVIDLLHKKIKSFKTIDYVYVLDEGGHLHGVLSTKDLYRAKKTTAVGKVCKKTPLISMKATTHQERAAYLALQHNIKAVPVTDHEHRFLGVITPDSILTILYKEMHEDYLRMVGIQHPRAHMSIFDLSLWESFKHRMPWLLLGLLGGLLSAKIIGLFEHTLEQNLILATFIPLIVYMGDAVGTQMEAYMIRDLAIDRHLRFGVYFLRQGAIVLLIAGACGVLLTGAALLFYGSLMLALTLGISLAAAILSSLCTGLFFPFIFSRLHMDPADASGPIATIIQDLLSVAIYLWVATWLL